MTPTPEGYRWTCPYCGESRLNRSDGASGETHTIAAVRAHIYASDGAGHGPRNAYPADLDSLALCEHVVRVDGPE